MKPILFDFPMPIVTDRLILRPPQIVDGIAVNEAILESFDVLNQFMPWAATKPSVNDSEEFVRRSAANWILKENSDPYLPLFIFKKDKNRFVGACGYHHYDWEIPCMETGYWIRSSLAQKGLMTEAVNAVTHYAFKHLRAQRIAITCDIDNARSKKIAERLGYQLEATIKSSRVNAKGELSDTLLYARYGLQGLPELNVSW